MCLRVLTAGIKHDENKLGMKGVDFSLQLSGHTLSLREIREGTKVRKLEAETEGETMEECCLLACFLWFTSLLSWIIQNHLKRGGIFHSELGSPTSIINQEDDLKVLSTCQHGGCVVSVEVSPSQITLTCDK